MGFKARDAAIVEVFLQTELRLGELVRLQLDDAYVPKKISAAADNAGCRSRAVTRVKDASATRRIFRNVASSWSEGYARRLPDTNF